MTTAMILAAGRGERLRPITDEMPKALVQVRGEAMIDRQLRMLAAAGVDQVVINLGWLGQQIVDHVGGGDRFGVRVVYSPEYEDVLETGGGICRALPMLGEDPFWTVNADVYSDFSIPTFDLDPSVDASIVLVPTPVHRPRGDFGLTDGLVRNVDDPGFTYSGFALYRPSFFDAAGDGRFSVAPMLKEAADAGKLGGIRYDGVWEDVGTPERLDFLNSA